MQAYDSFSQSSSRTIKSYIRHLPGDFHVSKQGRVDPAGSLKEVLENAPPPADAHPIVFRPLSDKQLQAAFTLQDGGYKRKKKKKKLEGTKEKENGGSGGSEEKKKKKKRNREGVDDFDAEQKKKKKKNKDKDKKSPESKIQSFVQPQMPLVAQQGAGFVRAR